MIETICELYEATTPAIREHGRSWYRLSERDVRRIARELPHGLGQSAAAAIFAALSPRTQYVQNWRGAYAFAVARSLGLAQPPAVGLNDARRKAWRIAHGERPAAVLRGDKVRSFWRALSGDPDAVVLDVWMCRALGVEQQKLTPSLYAELSAAFREAAARCDESARDLQAILWFHVRGIKPSDPMPGNFRPLPELI